MLERETLEIITSPEKEKPEVHPVIVTSVTLGKELHAGHMLLLGIADLLRYGLEIDEPVILVNNNTGPRAAGALLSLSQELNLEVRDTARLLSGGFIVPDKIVSAYRGRVQDEEALLQVMEILDEGEHDIFRIMAEITQLRLIESGFSVVVVPESGNLKDGQDVVEMINPFWSGSGFMFSQEKGVRVLKRGGQLTASGKCLVSLTALAKPVVEIGKVPLLVFVDSAPDTADAVVSYSSLGEFGKAMQLQGAGIGFGGRIASGTNGEAASQGEIAQLFGKIRPFASLSLAVRHMVLTKPTRVPYADTPNLADGIFDFKDNDSFIESLVECFDEASDFKKSVSLLIEDLRELIERQTRGFDAKVDRWLSFLPMRTKSTLETPPDRVVESMRNVGRILKNEGEIRNAVTKQGYKSKELDSRVQRYLDGPEGLVLRDNYYLGILRSIINTKDKILSLTDRDFKLFETTIEFCMRRLGYYE